MIETITSPHSDRIRPNFTVIEGGRATSPPLGSLAVVPLPREECLLTDVDDLARFRRSDGSYDPQAVVSIRQTKVTAVKEGAMPYAVSEVDHTWIPLPEADGGVIWDLGRTGEETAARGFLFYRYEASRARGEVEVDYARHNKTLRPGVAHVMIAPKMTRQDASHEIAKAEGLHETDSIQINWLELDKDNNPIAAKTTSILVADVPIEAWVAMLADENNIFGKAITVKDPKSALSVMQTFKELDIPLSRLSEGPIGILSAVQPYIKNSVVQRKVSQHLTEFRGDQAEMHQRSLSPAERWLKFDMETEQSLFGGIATKGLRQFIDSLRNNWNEEHQEILEDHRIVAGDMVTYRMSRRLAAMLQKAARNLILTSAAVVVRNQKVLDQMSAAVAERIYQGEMKMSQAVQHMGHLLTTHNSLIASQNTKVGGGCCGIDQAKFLSDEGSESSTLAEKERMEKSWHGGVIKKSKCKNCTGHTNVGVENWCEPCIKDPKNNKKAA